MEKGKTKFLCLFVVFKSGKQKIKMFSVYNFASGPNRASPGHMWYVHEGWAPLHLVLLGTSPMFLGPFPISFSPFENQ